MLRPSVFSSGKPFHDRGVSHPSSEKSPSATSRRFSVRPDSGLKSHAYEELQTKRVKWFAAREYLLLVIEAFLSLAAYVITERNLSVEELGRINLTTRQAMIEMLYYNGYSTILGMVIGCLADSYIRHYAVALFTVVLHFTVVSLVLMEEIILSYHININTIKDNPYAVTGWNLCTVTVVIIKSTDANRLVYGLQGMESRQKSAAYLFVFLQFWVSSYATHGGFFVNFFSALFKHTNISLTTAAFFGCGLSLVVFVYFLGPEEYKKEHRGLGCRVVGCLILAVYYKIFRVKIRHKKGFFDKTEGKFDRATILKTKEILMLYTLLMPTLGICFFKVVTTNSLFFTTVFTKIKPDKYTRALGLEQMGRVIKMIFMLVSYCGLWPLLVLIGFKNTHTDKFLVGHFLVLVFMYYVGFVAKGLEIPNYSYNSGLVRVFNSREHPIHLIPQDRDFTTHTISVEPMEGVTTSYPFPTIKGGPDYLFAMNAVFNGTKTNFTTYISVTADKTTGYITVDPPCVQRIRGPFLPLREGPPGTNIGSWPRIYIYNTAKTLDGFTMNIRPENAEKALMKITLESGVMATRTLKPGKYDFTIKLADVGLEGVELGAGGVYGILSYPTTFSRELVVDIVIPPNTTPSWVAFVGYLLCGLAMGLGNPTLLAMVFNISPQGLPAMSLCFAASLEGVSMWLCYMGFKTWHRFVTSNVLFLYAFGVTFFFFLSIFVLLKFRNYYNIE